MVILLSTTYGGRSRIVVAFCSIHQRRPLGGNQPFRHVAEACFFGLADRIVGGIGVYRHTLSAPFQCLIIIVWAIFKHGHVHARSLRVFPSSEDEKPSVWRQSHVRGIAGRALLRCLRDCSWQITVQATYHGPFPIPIIRHGVFC